MYDVTVRSRRLHRRLSHSCGGVGSNTIARNLQVYSTFDDGIEMFGGSFDIENFFDLYARDDTIDIDEGYNGTITNALAIQNVDDSGAGITAPTVAAPNEAIEEVVVMGRLIDSGQQLALERMDDAAVVDLLGGDTISRLGDSTVAVALKRVPGLSVVGNKFVYIRRLGERYSQSTLNGAFIPSPDLTRNGIPLGIFPTAIVDSLRVQKAYTTDMRANFAGGSVDIRTKGIPDDFTVLFEIGSGFNTAVDGNVFSYVGGSRDALGYDNGERAICGALLDQVTAFQGQVGTQEILISEDLELGYSWVLPTSTNGTRSRPSRPTSTFPKSKRVTGSSRRAPWPSTPPGTSA